MAAHRSGAPADRGGRKDHLVLVVDDNRERLSAFCTVLVRFGYKILKATTAKRALATSVSLLPSLVIVSLDLPGMEGFKLLRQLKSSPATAHIPLIGTIRNDSPGLRERCIEHGALDYLRQPIEADAFYSAVQAAIEKNPRSCIRLRTVLPVKVHGNAGDSLYGAYTLAISADGMFLRTTSPLSLNSRISLELNVSGRAIAAETEVVYSCQTGACEEPGVGLRFIDISRSDRALIRQFIQREVMKGITGGNS